MSREELPQLTLMDSLTSAHNVRLEPYTLTPVLVTHSHRTQVPVLALTHTDKNLLARHGIWTAKGLLTPNASQSYVAVANLTPEPRMLRMGTTVAHMELLAIPESELMVVDTDWDFSHATQPQDWPSRINSLGPDDSTFYRSPSELPPGAIESILEALQVGSSDGDR
jgi:hypothetical protein